MEYTKKLIHQSNYWYNDGLSKAQIHDTSGAIASLRKSLQCNQRNVTARNLLGLVYYARGEVGEALVEWIISKNFQSHENIADYFIKKVQGNPTELEVMNNAIKKYNQCLVYCEQNGEDLALIQLKKVVQAHPTFLKAQLLLALLYIRTEQYGRARQVLKRAHKLDTTNEMALRYMHELSKINNGKKAAKVQEEKDHTVTYQVGNETIIQPAAAGVKDNGILTTILNILIGLAVGAAAMWFLVVPGMDQIQSSKLNKQIVKYSDQIAAKNAEISALKKELEGYRETNADTEAAKKTAESTKESYEALLVLESDWRSKEKSDAAMLDELLKIRPETLGEKAANVYQKIHDDIAPRICKKNYRSGKASFEEGSYQDAIQALQTVTSLDEKYDDGQALVLLTQAYEKAGKTEEYKATYEKLKELYPEEAAKLDQEKKEEEQKKPEENTEDSEADGEESQTEETE